MTRILVATVILVAAASSFQPAVANACPMCKVANEDAPAFDANGTPIDANARPRAYMYSILFMLSMPAMLLSGFVFAFHRMTRRAAGASVQPLGDVAFSPNIVPAKN
jgi:hypothetical protein